MISPGSPSESAILSRLPSEWSLKTLLPSPNPSSPSSSSPSSPPPPSSTPSHPSTQPRTTFMFITLIFTTSTRFDAIAATTPAVKLAVTCVPSRSTITPMPGSPPSPDRTSPAAMRSRSSPWFTSAPTPPQAPHSLAPHHPPDRIHHALVVPPIRRREPVVGLHPNHGDIVGVPNCSADTADDEAYGDLTVEWEGGTITSGGPLLLEDVVEAQRVVE